MSDRTIGNNQPRQATAPSVEEQPRQWRRNALVAAGTCTLVAGLAWVGWYAAEEWMLRPTDAVNALSAGSRLVPTADPGTALASAPPATSAPAASASDAGERDSDEVPPTLVRELADLRSAHERLTQRSLETDQRLGRVEAEVADLRGQLDAVRAANAQARKRAAALARQLELARAAAEQPKPIQRLPRVLSVDTWNGRTSVAVQVGEEVRFVVEGDIVADALVRKADPDTQRVEFVPAGDGATATSTSSRAAR